jgi:hypothetical protein
MLVVGASWWRRQPLWGWIRDRWGQTVVAVSSTWRRLGTFDRVRTGVQLIVVIYLLSVFPWRGSNFDIRRFIIGVLIVAGAAIYLTIYQFPARARKYSGEIAFGAAVVTFLLTPRSTTSREFYSTAAQVVPVLFLTLAFEQEVFRVRRNMDPGDRHFATLPAVGLLLAGFEAFRGLLDKPEKASLQLVTSGLVFGSTALFIRAIAGRRPS